MDTSKELKSNRPLNVISFCSGYGGIERGLDLAGTDHRVLAYVEIEAYAIANLVNKMESGQLDAAPIYSNLKTFPAHLFRDCVDLLAGGYPCQPFSSAGKRGGEQDPRHLWPYIREHINAIRPTQCFFENVEGHISLGLSSVISDMEEDGYSTTWQIFSASEVGAPHQRKRVYILGSLQYANTDSGDGSSKQEREHEGAEELSRSSEGRVGSPFPDTNSSRCQQGNQETEGQPSEQLNGDSLQRKTTYPDIERLQGRLQRGIIDPQGWEEQEVRCTTQRSDRWSWDRHNIWSSEPNVDRVVDGCADRVDRIRLLGNGVVPQTAARAWEVLNEMR